MGDDKMAMAADFEEALQTGDMGAMNKLTQKWGTDDFVTEWPQSGERLRRDAIMKMSESYGEMSGSNPKFTYKRMLGGDDVFIIEGTVDYGDGVPVSYVGVGEMRDGKVSRMTEYFANPFPAPDWRKPFVEQM
ncbi:MAG: nuclear transport factor 2 family protein [Candidatus Limnocylindrales bacterium]